MNNRPTLRSAGGLSTLIVLAGAIAANPAAAFKDSDRATIRAGGDAWIKAAIARDAKALAVLYAEDAVLLPANAEAVRGSKAIAEFFAQFPPFKDAKMTQIEIEGANDMAYVWGTFSMMIQVSDDVAVPEHGKYIEVWRKQGDGSWKITHDIFNSDLPVPGMEAEKH